MVPPAGYLAGVRELCTERNVLFIADEIQSGLGPHRRRRSPASTRASCPDMYMLGKALGGGIVPVSAVAAERRRARRAAARASTARRSAATRWPARSATPWSSCWRTGEFQRARRPSWASGCTTGCAALVGQGVIAVRGRGLWAGIDIDPALMTGRQACERLMARGRAGQGHPRLDDPARPAAGHHRSGDRPRGGPARRRPRRLTTYANWRRDREGPGARLSSRLAGRLPARKPHRLLSARGPSEPISGTDRLSLGPDREPVIRRLEPAAGLPRATRRSSCRPGGR